MNEYWDWAEDYMTDPNNAYRCEGCPANVGGENHLPCRERYCSIESYRIRKENEDDQNK